MRGGVEAGGRGRERQGERERQGLVGRDGVGFSNGSQAPVLTAYLTTRSLFDLTTCEKSDHLGAIRLFGPNMTTWDEFDH